LDCSWRCYGYKTCHHFKKVIAKSLELCKDCIHSEICKIYKKHYYVYLNDENVCKYRKVKE